MTTTRRIIDRTLDLDTLEVLEQVAATGSITRAAESLGVTQQAVSARVRIAERTVGHQLVRRSPSGSSLTETGRLVLGLAQPVLEAADRLDAGIRALQQPSGELVVAASQTIAELMLPEWLLEFQRRAPGVTVRLVAGNSATVADLVRAGGAHLGFCEGPHAPVGLDSVDVVSDELVVVVSPTHAWSHIASASPALLAATPLLVREEGSGTRATIENYLGTLGSRIATPAAVLETSGIIRANARAGIAPAVLSSRFVESELTAGSLVRVPLAGPAMERTFRGVWSGQLSPLARDFLAVARE